MNLVMGQGGWLAVMAWGELLVEVACSGGEIERGWTGERAFYFFPSRNKEDLGREKDEENMKERGSGERERYEENMKERELQLSIVKSWVSHFSKYLQKCNWVMLFENWKLVRIVL